ncbi:MAG: SGNH/GDSL hydrolase family protein [Oscillospiraceae bacterium]|nr:SGNH/GDSL hydrolase family protein [Oscillospiraceae bacterium]
MKIIEKIAKRAQDATNPRPTIAFLGDSVTEGCFELIPKNSEGFNNVYDGESVYHKKVAEILKVLFPTVLLNIVNAGAAGTGAVYGLERLERDVLSKNPDLTVVCFGLNDCGKEDDGISEYIESLRKIFARLREAGSEVIFMTPCMLAEKVSETIHPSFVELAEKLSDRQRRGVLDRYMDAARALCAEENVPVCDAYAKWKRMSELGVDVTELLANKLNHPIRELHNLFAVSLVETMMR